MTTLTKSVVVENSIYLNTDDFGFDIFLLLESDTIIMTNLTIQNVNGTGTNSEYYIMMSLNEGGTATLTQVNFMS